MATRQRKKKPPIKKPPSKQAEPAQKKVGVGRPTLYSTSLNTKAYNLALAGFTIDEIALAWGFDQQTIRRWMVEHPQFCESVTRGREEADGKVARALYKRALGMKLKKQQAVKVRIGADERVEIVDVTEEIPPDTGAATNWLANRQRGKWSKERRDSEHEESKIGDFLSALNVSLPMDAIFGEEADS